MTRSLTRTTYRLFAIVGAATAAAYLGLVFASVLLLEKSGLPHFVQVSMQVVGVLTPIGVAVWWIYKKLRPDYPARTARKGAMAFAVFTLVSWGVAFPLSTLSGAALGDWAGSYFFRSGKCVCGSRDDDSPAKPRAMRAHALDRPSRR